MENDSLTDIVVNNLNCLQRASKSKFSVGEDYGEVFRDCVAFNGRFYGAIGCGFKGAAFGAFRYLETAFYNYLIKLGAPKQVEAWPGSMPYRLVFPDSSMLVFLDLSDINITSYLVGTEFDRTWLFGCSKYLDFRVLQIRSGVGVSKYEQLKNLARTSVVTSQVQSSGATAITSWKTWTDYSDTDAQEPWRDEDEEIRKQERLLRIAEIKKEVEFLWIQEKMIAMGLQLEEEKEEPKAEVRIFEPGRRLFRDED